MYNEKQASDLNSSFKLRSTPPWFVWPCALACLVSGVFSSMVFKVMNRQDVEIRSGEVVGFEGALLQPLLMFIGEALCLLTWWIDLVISHRKGLYPLFDFVKNPEDLTGQAEGKMWWWIFPSVLDCAATTIFAYAQQITYSSTVAMLRNFMVVIGAILQLCLIRKALRIHEYFGVAFITGAMFLAAIPAIIDPDDSGNDGSTVVAVIIVLIGTALQSTQLIFEDFLFRKGRINTLKAVGIEGIAGIVLTVILMPIFDVANLDSVWDSWYQWSHSGTLIGVSIAYIFCALLFNASGLSCTKLASGLLRGVIFAVRAPIVWIVELCLSWNSYDHYNLASIFVFLIGFALYVKIPLGSTIDTWMRKPVHFWCTKPELDDDWTGRQEIEEEEPTTVAQEP